MKKVTTTEWIKKEEHKFIADDLKVFDTESACRAYEMKNKLSEAEQKFNQISKQICIPFFEWSSQEDFMYIVTMNDLNDYKILEDYAYAYCGSACDIKMPDKFPARKIVVVGYDYVTFPVGCYFTDNPSVLVKQLQECIDKIENSFCQEKKYIVKTWEEIVEDKTMKISNNFVAPRDEAICCFIIDMAEKYGGQTVTFMENANKIKLADGTVEPIYTWKKWMLKEV